MNRTAANGDAAHRATDLPPIEPAEDEGAFKLVYIYRGDFRKNEATLTEEAVKEFGRTLKAQECIMMISGTEKVVRFVHAVVHKGNEVDRRGSMMEGQVKVLPSRTFRILDGGFWHPYMIKHYAAELGITLKGLKTLDQHIKRETERS